MNPHKVAYGLGWFSIALGLYEVLEAEQLGRALGLEDKKGLIRFYGVRELTAGVGILSGQTKLAPWLWARVGGDGFDLATLGAGLSPNNPKRQNAIIAFAMVVGITLLDIWCALKLTEQKS
jgi:hypothetical protein